MTPGKSAKKRRNLGPTSFHSIFDKFIHLLAMSSPGPSPASAHHGMIHKFRNEWQFWLVLVESVRANRQYKIHEIAKFGSAENFAKYYHMLPRPDEFKIVDNKRTSLAVFRDEIKPAWEDEANKTGGHFTFEMNNPEIVKEAWKMLLLLLLSGDLSDDCNGIVCGIKKDTQWIAEVWMRGGKAHKVSEIITAAIPALKPQRWCPHSK
jgi:translation initiation factor 4E